jgi:ferredoxin
MQIKVDRGKCEGYGMCTATAPHLFWHNDDGVLTLAYDQVPVPPEFADDAEYAVSCCPARALSATKQPS